MKKKNVAQSAHSDDVRDHVPDKESRNDHLERLASVAFFIGRRKLTELFCSHENNN
jgi:hypothetical protein